MYKNIGNQEFKLGIAHEDSVLIDVRSSREITEGMIPGAIHLDIMTGAFSKAASEMDPSKSYYIYCRSGNRSGAACSFLAQKGFNNLHNLRDGIMSWDGEIAVPQV